MLGAIIGDVIGSYYEGNSTKDRNFPLFTEISRVTDDSVLTIAVAETILASGTSSGIENYSTHLRVWGERYPQAGYGGRFIQWLEDKSIGAYNSWGNGSAMRVSPAGWAFEEESEVLRQSELSASATHNHPEGIKGAQAVALAVYLARKGESKTMIREVISRTFSYNLHRSWKEIQPDYDFEVSCQKSVPEAIIAFLDSKDFEGALRNAIALGGDADTQAAIAGSIAEAFYGGIPDKFLAFVLPRLPGDILNTTLLFARRFLPMETVEALERESDLRSPDLPNGLYKKWNRYTVLLHSEAQEKLKAYAAACRISPNLPGKKLKKRFLDPMPWKMDKEGVLRSLLETKPPCIYAESDIAGDGSDWNRTELDILGDISIAVPVTVYDNGEHYKPEIHNKPFKATLLYTPGALLANGRRQTPVDWDVVQKGKINPDTYFNLYERRLLPVLKYTSIMAIQKKKKAFITIPGLGCGQFAGKFRGTLQVHLRDALIKIIRKHHHELPGIKAIWYDPYRECTEERQDIGSISFFVRPLTMAKPGKKNPQLCHPVSFEEKGDDFSNCSLF
ncbi:MAG: ADP-ribosylglycohydrolase family protein, partial [Spirochaetaceae bacterium]|nr:ADP-ribosylglycohydrolase family protein [Spirochaetaceae bacterium]